MENKLIDILKKTKIPFDRNIYTGKDEQYITWNIYSTRFSIYKDDKASETIGYITINIYSKVNYIEIKNKLLSLINNSEDFILLDIENEDFEKETGYYHCPINIAYL